MRVFRVQDAYGRGPYVGPGWPVWGPARRFDHDNAAHPSPLNDGLEAPAMRGECAFTSRAQARAWFSPAERRIMRRAGYVLHEFDAPPDTVAVLGHQAVIDLKRARLVGKCRW